MNYSDLPAAAKRCADAPATLRSGMVLDHSRSWPDKQDYTAQCNKCGYWFRGEKGRIQGRRCYLCSEPKTHAQHHAEVDEVVDSWIAQPITKDATGTTLIDAWLPCIPPTTTAQQKGVRIIRKGNKSMPMFFTKGKVKKAETMLKALLAPICPKELIPGPLSLWVEFVFPWRKGENKATRGKGRMPHDVRPDCSNQIKLIEDCMTELGFWNDDGQISELTVRKFWGSEPGIKIEIRRL